MIHSQKCRHEKDSLRPFVYAPRVFADDPHNDTFSKPDFAAAMNLLFSEGQIELRSYRKENRHMGERIETTGATALATADEFDFG